MDVSKNSGIPQNGWFIMEIPMKLDDLGGKPTTFGNTLMAQQTTTANSLQPDLRALRGPGFGLMMCAAVADNADAVHDLAVPSWPVVF